MFYGEILDMLLETEKNPVNKMYINELSIKWKKVEQSAAAKTQSNDSLVKALNDFTKQLNNRKYKAGTSSTKGFDEESPLFAPRYLDDLISVFMQRRSVLQHLGIKWGRQSFSAINGLNPINICSIQDEPNFIIEDSPEFLMLSQKIDFQFRISGKRRFNKYLLNLPLLVFHTYRVLTLGDVIQVEYYANMAKKTFTKAKIIIVAEMIDKTLMPDVKALPIDTVFVLRKQNNSDPLEPIALDVVNLLDEKITDLLIDKDIADSFKETGIISQ